MEKKCPLLQIDISSEVDFNYNETIITAARATVDKGEVSILIVGKEKMQELNKQYRGKDYATDVLSFPQDDEVLGDIVICLDKAKEQADEYCNTLEREISFLTVHGCLHLIGYDHEIDEEHEKEMFTLQDEIMEKIFGCN